MTHIRGSQTHHDDTGSSQHSASSCGYNTENVKHNSGFTPIVKDAIARLRQLRFLKKNEAMASSTTGFTLIELTVAMSIMLIITGAALANHNRFNSEVLLTNLAYDIALSVRQAQVYGISVRETEPGTAQFNDGYGVHFTANAPQQYVLFVDEDNDRMYDGSSEALETYTIGRGNQIDVFCATPPSTSQQCSDGVLTDLDIIFERPNPEAFFTTDTGSNYESATITVVSPAGDSRTITVSTTGEIQVDEQQ